MTEENKTTTTTKLIERSRTIHSAICAPSVRTVRLEIYVDEDKTWHSISPVIAIVSRTEEVWSKMVFVKSHPSLPYDPENDGWSYEGTNNIINVVIPDEEYGNGSLAEHGVSSTASNAEYSVIPCYWPPESDEAQLAETIASVSKRLRGNLKPAKNWLNECKLLLANHSGHSEAAKDTIKKFLGDGKISQPEADALWIFWMERADSD